MIPIQDIHQFKNFLKNFDLVVVDVWKDKCEPCKYLTPKLLQVENILDNPRICFLEENENVGIHLPEGYPSVYFYVKGELYHTTLGADYPEIIQKIAEILPSLGVSLTEEQKILLKDLPIPKTSSSFSQPYRPSKRGTNSNRYKYATFSSF